MEAQVYCLGFLCFYTHGVPQNSPFGISAELSRSEKGLFWVALFAATDKKSPLGFSGLLGGLWWAIFLSVSAAIAHAGRRAHAYKFVSQYY